MNHVYLIMREEEPFFLVAEYILLGCGKKRPGCKNNTFFNGIAATRIAAVICFSNLVETFLIHGRWRLTGHFLGLYHLSHLNISNVPKKCSVYLHLPWLGNVSTKFDKLITATI